MADSRASRNAVELLAEEFLDRYRQGDRPPLRQYTDQYPDLAAEIRELFPAMLLLENLKPVEDDRPAAGGNAPEERRPKQLGDYRIIREVGRGGMGIVYEAEQVSLGRHVALKVLPEQLLLDPRHKQRFEREARAAARLHHTNIVPVFGVGEQDGLQYYAMQFIQGLGLDQLLNDLRRMHAGRAGDAFRPGAGSPSQSADAAVARTAELARSLMMGEFDRTVLAICMPEGGQPEQDQAAVAVSPVPEFEVSPPDPPDKPVVRPEARADTATLRLSDTLSLAESGVLPGRSQAASSEEVKPRTYWQSVALIGAQVASALSYAHEQGILHRDIKPSNLLLDVRGTVWVTDFGLAKTNDQQDLTHTGDFLGTLRYIPPESFEGRLDPRGDVYSLGLTLYELLALRPAFDDKDRRKLIALVTTGTPPRLAKLNPEIPRDLATIVQKAIDRDPRLRYQSAREFGDDLSRFLTDVPVRARRSGFLERTWRWCRRNPNVAVLTGTVAALVATVFVGALVSTFWLNAERQATRNQLQLTTKAEGEARKAEGEARKAEGTARLQLYHSRVDEARANRMSRRSGQRFKSLEILAEAARMARAMSLGEEELLKLRNEAIACLALPDAQVQRTWAGWPPGTVWAEFDQVFERYARTDRQGNVHVHRAVDGIEIWVLAGAGAGESFAKFSPGGQYLIHGAKVWSLAGPSPVLLMERPAELLAFAPDDGQLACHDSDRTLRLLALPEGNETAHFDTRVIAAVMAYHPDGRLLALSHRSGIQLRSLESGEVQELAVDGGASAVAWSPDGKLLAADCGDLVIRIWDVTRGERISQLIGHRNGGIRMAFSRAGDVLASSDWDGVLRLWDPQTGEQLFQARLAAAVQPFPLDDKHAAAAVPRDGNLGILEIAPVRNFYRTLVRDPVLGQALYFPPAISPDGRLLAVGMSDGVGFWDRTESKPLAFLPVGYTQGVVFEPSGALLTSGPTGVLRWPVEADPVAPDVLRIGNPQPLPLPGYTSAISMSRDGRIVAKAMNQGGVIWRRDLPQEPLMVGMHGDTRSVAVSPDGKWVATGSHTGPNVRIWDTTTGKLAHELVLEIMNGVLFSPDGRWLVTTSGGSRLWSTDSWKEVRFIGGNAGVEFSPDGRILAVENLQGAVRLINPETGVEYASLEDPHQDVAGRIGFAPDGTQLVTTNTTSGSIHTWNLRTIRAELSEMGLDWDLPAYAPPGPDANRPLTAVAVPDGISTRARSPQQ